MRFEILREKRPAYPVAAMIVVLVLSILLLGAGAAFAYLLVSGQGNDYLWGSLLAFELLIAGIEIILFARYFVPFREVSEDREEELLW